MKVIMITCAVILAVTAVFVVVQINEDSMIETDHYERYNH